MKSNPHFFLALSIVIGLFAFATNSLAVGNYAHSNGAIYLAAADDDEEDDDEAEAVDYRDRVREVQSWMHKRSAQRRGDSVPDFSPSSESHSSNFSGYRPSYRVRLRGIRHRSHRHSRAHRHAAWHRHADKHGTAKRHTRIARTGRHHHHEKVASHRHQGYHHAQANHHKPVYRKSRFARVNHPRRQAHSSSVAKRHPRTHASRPTRTTRHHLVRTHGHAHPHGSYKKQVSNKAKTVQHKPKAHSSHPAHHKASHKTHKAYTAKPAHTKASHKSHKAYSAKPAHQQTGHVASKAKLAQSKPTHANKVAHKASAPKPTKHPKTTPVKAKAKPAKSQPVKAAKKGKNTH